MAFSDAFGHDSLFSVISVETEYTEYTGSESTAEVAETSTRWASPTCDRGSDERRNGHRSRCLWWARRRNFRAQSVCFRFSFLNFVQLSVERRRSCMRCPPLNRSSSRVRHHSSLVTSARFSPINFFWCEPFGLPRGGTQYNRRRGDAEQGEGDDGETHHRVSGGAPPGDGRR